jgi:nicotinamide-nucleotide amidase
MYTISYLSIGSELLDGRVIDTNSVFMSRSLIPLGIDVAARISTDDRIEDIISALSYLSKISDCIIVTGGLGPTTDDLTREAISEFTRCPLLLNEESLEKLKRLYEIKKRNFDTSNEKQSLFPKTSKIILNPVGTAPGFSIEHLEQDKKVLLIALPGVPRELVAMFEDSVLPLLKDRLPLEQEPLLHNHLLCVYGLPESVIGSKVTALSLPKEIKISYRAMFPEVHVQLRGRGNIGKYAQQIVEVLGEDNVYAENVTTTLGENIHALLIESQKTVAVAESCSGGMLSEILTLKSGASKFFLGSIVAYDNTVKAKLLSVSSQTLEQHGAVSHKAAAEMALGVRTALGSDFGISITGIAGPQGGTDDKPVGTFFIGLSTPQELISFRAFFHSERDLIRKYSAVKAIDILRRKINTLHPPKDTEIVTHLL